MKNDSYCPKCSSENTYVDGNLWVCPECSYEWSALASTTTKNLTPKEQTQTDGDHSVRDAHGNALVDGDAVTVVKELKIKDSSSVVKVGTKVKGIRLVDGADGHNISCKIDGIGAMNLKSEFVKKV